MRTSTSCRSINLARTDPSYELKTIKGSVLVWATIRPDADRSLTRILRFTSSHWGHIHPLSDLWSGPKLVRIGPTWRTVRSFSAFWQSSSGILFRHKTSWSKKPTVPLNGGHECGPQTPAGPNHHLFLLQRSLVSVLRPAVRRRASCGTGGPGRNKSRIYVPSASRSAHWHPAAVRVLHGSSAAAADEDTEDADWWSFSGAARIQESEPGAEPWERAKRHRALRLSRAGDQRRSVGVRFSDSSLFVRTAALPPPASRLRHTTTTSGQYFQNKTPSEQRKVSCLIHFQELLWFNCVLYYHC